MASRIHVEICTPARRVVEREVDEVVLPGYDGSFGVLPGHAPLLTALSAGVAECRVGGEKERLAISEGFAEIGPERVTVMAETAEREDEIDEARAKEKVEQIQALMTGEGHDVDFDRMRIRLLKHLARLSAKQG